MIVIKYIFALISILSFLTSSLASEKKSIKIGSGSILEGYYSIGLNICDFLESSSDLVSDCEVIPTNGSIENLALLQEGKIDFALVQSNIALDSYEGKGRYLTSPPNHTLRQLLTLHDELFTIITKDDDKIRTVTDVAGKKISNGDRDSASTISYEAVRELYSFARPIDVELSPEEYAKKLCDGDIDVIMIMTGHPNALVSHVAHKCEVNFVAIDGDKLSKLTKNNDPFFKATIKKGFYPGISEDQDTIGSHAVLITNDKADRQIIEDFLKYFDKNIPSFKGSSILLRNLDNGHFTSNFVLPAYNGVNKKAE